MLTKIDPRHQVSKRVLRIVGPSALLVGGVLAALGISDFFSATSTGAWPSRFWLAFVGIPLAGAGLTLTKWAFLGEISRYTAGEVAPVAQSTLTFLGHGATIDCPSCGTSNERGSTFCEECGTPLTATCPSCGHENEVGSKFCQGCGTAL